jgi:hypothetical protein
VTDPAAPPLVAPGRRKGLGSYFTPPALVEALLDLALDPLLAARAIDGAGAVASLRIVDPACGDGNLLVGVVERLAASMRRLGIAEGDAVDEAVRCVAGTELDPSTAARCRERLGAMSGAFVPAQIVVGDGLLVDPLPAGSVDLVVGNPPFLSQLRTGTTQDRSTAAADARRDRFGDAIGAYTDPAALFLAAAHRLARPDGGVVAMIEPTSLLTARDAGAVRRSVVADGSLVDLWIIGDGGFDAAVEVCAVVIERAARAHEVRLHAGVERRPSGRAPAPTAADATWSSLLAAHAGLPHRDLATSGTLAGLATATADFRDQYYGLVGHVVDRAVADEAAFPRLITSGLIDAAALRWGERPARFAKERYAHPRVDRAALAGAMATWAEARLVPKVLLATQTRVLEAVADPRGSLLPSVPVISVVPRDPADLWRVAAVLTCPAVAAEASRRHLGSGRTSRSVRLRAAEVLDLPLPSGRDRWDEAAALLSTGAPLEEVGAAMDAAYGLEGDEALLEWWIERT